MLELMKQYNILIERWNKAEAYFANETITVQEKETHNEELTTLHDRLVATQEEIVRNGYEMSKDEVARGFRQIKFIIDSEN